MSKKELTLYILSGVAVFLFFVIARTPADLVLAQIAKKTNLITPSQVSGTIWNGSAGDISIRHDKMVIPLGSARWEISFWSLLTGKISIDLKAKKSDQKIEGQFTLGSGPYISASDAEIIFDAALVKQFYPVPGDVKGSVELSLKEFEYADSRVEALQGSAVLKDSVYTLGSPVELGTYAARLSLKEDMVVADLSDIDARVEVSGVAKVSPETKKYSADVNLKPRPEANPMIQQTLKAVAKSKPDGSFQFVL